MAEEKVTPAVEEEASKAEETKTEEKAQKAAPKKKAAPKDKTAEKKPAAKKTAKKAEGGDTEKPAAKKKPARQGATVVISAVAKAKEEKLATGTLKLTLKRGLLGRTERQKAVAYSLGLKRPGDVSIQPDNAPTRGKIKKIDFLLSVSRV